MCAVTVAVLIDIIEGDSFTPRRAAFEFGMLDKDACVDNINIYAFTALSIVYVFAECAKSEPGPMAYTSETLLKR
jgi:hypothetical protein